MFDRWTWRICRRTVGDARLQPPVVPMDACVSGRRNAQGEPVLPNEHAWRPDLALKVMMSNLLALADKKLDMPVSLKP